MIEIAIMGHGVVGSGVLREFPDSPLADRFTKNFDEILNDVEIRVVAEVMGGIHPAFEYVSKLLAAGKSVATSNKELVAAKGAELLRIAKENNVNFLFEASVGGGIPIIRPLNQCLVANNVKEIAGILNGTTNFILTKMIKDGMGFDEALKLAQKLGFAERNPAADIEGHDAVRKICILASLAYGKHIYPDNIHTEGITNITLEDVKFAKKFDCVIKLIGDVKVLDDDRMDIFVAPMLISKNSQLANIDNEFNGIMVRGDCTDDVVFYSKGAGSMPTASAVVADIVDCGKHLKRRKFLFWVDSDNENILPYNESRTAMFLRLKSGDKAVAIERFGDIQVIAEGDECALITPVLTIGEIEQKLEGIDVLSKIRIGDL